MNQTDWSKPHIEEFALNLLYYMFISCCKPLLMLAVAVLQG